MGIPRTMPPRAMPPRRVPPRALSPEATSSGEPSWLEAAMQRATRVTSPLLVVLAACGLLVSGLLPGGVAPVMAQEGPPAGQEEDLESIGGDDIDVSRIEHILRGEQESQRGAVSSYDPAGRRDPFKSLLEGREESDEEASGVRPPGLAGMLIEELKLGGIIQTESGILAFVQGRDNLSYIIRPGTKLYNGEVKEILPKKVIFRQQVNDPKQLKPYEEIVREVAD